LARSPSRPELTHHERCGAPWRVWTSGRAGATSAGDVDDGVRQRDHGGIDIRTTYVGRSEQRRTVYVTPSFWGRSTVSTHDLYTAPVENDEWAVPAFGAARFSWEYDDGRERLLSLYQKGKDKQWDAA